MLIATACLSINQAGTAIVNDIGGQPALGIFIWKDGADFQWLVNNCMGYAIPPPMNPNPPSGTLEHLSVNVSTSEVDFKSVASALLQDT